jgi:endonuclease YncB( thermonuclease family)
MFVLLVAISSSKIVLAETLLGEVVSIHDGDTVTLITDNNQKIKVRLAQIDAPEIAQNYGEQSKQYLSNLVLNKRVTVETETIDKYGRTVGTLILNGVDVNAQQVKVGMAWAYRKYLHNTGLLTIEENARLAKTGLWSDLSAIAPWDYRHFLKSDHYKTSFK